MFHRAEQVGAESPASWVCRAKTAARQQACEKFLREFTRRIDEQIARAGAALTDGLPPTNASEVASSEVRSLHSRTRYSPDVIDRTRRQR